MTRASGTFEVTLTPQVADAYFDAVSMGRLTIDKTFRGDLEGTSRGQMMSAVTAVKGSAGYVALERVTGTVEGKSGTFVLQHSGTMNRGSASLTLAVVPDSGTAALTGISGSMQIIIEGGKHSYIFDYELAAS
jgi:hypothetical protein